jgi:hypothetical protein
MRPLARSERLAMLPLAMLACVLAAVATAPAPVRAEPEPEASIPDWTGGVDLYRKGTFATQRTWRWCTAADVQIARNIVHEESDQTRSRQERYYRYMRAHNRYDMPAKDGVDPAGWTAGLRKFVDDRYRLVRSDSFGSALRSAVTSLRRTNLPVGLTVAHGEHAWLLTGFTATADPLESDDFRVTSVRVTGPLWGLQSRTRGYDMRPNTKLTPGQLRDYFTPWHYAGIRMVWAGQWVSIQPIGKAEAPTEGTPATAQPTIAAPVGPSTPSPTSSSVAAARIAPRPSAAALSSTPADDVGSVPTAASSTSVPAFVGAALLGLVLLAALGLAGMSRRRRDQA